ncbi:hypothetical protein M409DRAFT_51517 [Zasmidium cellare ATCC 36951]|uniref:Uncharacterized protein n=1 Tax=Zasmidium cellare ATCC 36951 TaxID=1080233 RepID=A0A6A6CW94_ZASCE|nr:uncharacterized protein M409DRAFT_51517 [Zasmidium cellare ATCC 36951]KAF2170478.1 hypothetical protein M409DRAFT_51517 [Zasmidium cellare ATCC 36951]
MVRDALDSSNHHSPGICCRLLFTIGHHLFYTCLQGTPVDDGMFAQQYNLAIGSAFAFLVRASLVLSIGAVYWQLFWRTLLSKDLPLETVDSLTSLLGSLVDLLLPRSWVGSPLLVAIAIVSWLIPFSTIIPPATLTVRLIPDVGHNQQSLRTPNFLARSLADTYLQQSDGDMANGPPRGYYVWNTYHGPTNNLARTVSSTACSGELPKLPSPATNASYVLSYIAPSLRCEAIPDFILSGFVLSMGCDPSLAFESAELSDSCYMYERQSVWNYLSWAPNSTAKVPFDNGSFSGGSLPINDGSPSSFLGNYESSPANLFVAVPGNLSEGWKVLNCSLFNATYNVNFTFQEDAQMVKVLDVNITNPILPLFSNDRRRSNVNISQTDFIRFNAQSLMDSLGCLMVGSVATADSTFSSEHATDGSMGVADAFTTEMYPIYTSSCDAQTTGYCSGSQSVTSSTEASPTSKWYQRPLADAMEDLFQNMTLSLFSRSEFLGVADEASTNVTITTVRNVYAYNRQRLWLAYGLAVGFCFVVLCVGCFVVLRAGATYSNKLSTVLRVTGGDRVDVDIDPNDRGGADLLPAHLEKAKLLCPLGSESFKELDEPGGPKQEDFAEAETSAMIQRPTSRPEEL